MSHHQRATTSTIHKHLMQLQREALSGGSIKIPDTKGKKGIDNPPLIVYPSPCMSNILAAIKCKHCDKVFPSQDDLQNHMRKVNSGKQGGFRKHKALRRYPLPKGQNIRVKQAHTRNHTALDRLAEISAREEQLLAALKQISVDKEAAMAEVQREYDARAKSLAELSTVLTVKRKAEIAAREEMEAHKSAPPET